MHLRLIHIIGYTRAHQEQPESKKQKLPSGPARSQTNAAELTYVYTSRQPSHRCWKAIWLCLKQPVAKCLTGLEKHEKRLLPTPSAKFPTVQLVASILTGYTVDPSNVSIIQNLVGDTARITGAYPVHMTSLQKHKPMIVGIPAFNCTFFHDVTHQLGTSHGI